MNGWAAAACSSFTRVGRSGGDVDCTDDLTERVQPAPGEEARQELAPTVTGPAPSRWTVRGVRATFAWLQAYSVSGVWRLLQRHNLHLRAAHVRQHSPDPTYTDKVATLLACLRAAATQADTVVLFLDDMGYYRWPVEGWVWGFWG